MTVRWRRRDVLAAGAAFGCLGPQAASAQQAPPEGVVVFGPGDFVADAGTGLRLADVAFPPAPSRRARLAAQDDGTPGARLLARLRAQGGAGSVGDVYDNRDRGHSRLDPRDFPGLTLTRYDDAARAARLDYGLNPGVGFRAAVFGNSSTALTGGATWRSLPRAAMTGGGMPTAARLYAANHLYVFPEHRDHDAGRGDLFPAATAQMVVSQGSSGSDKPFLRAIAAILAVMPPAAKRDLAERGLIAPTVQAILRRGMAGIVSDEDYLSARAHPSALDGAAIELERMLRDAASLAPGAAPAPPRLRVLIEAPDEGAMFGEGLTERLFDTPDAIARVARGPARLRRWRLAADAPAVEGGPAPRLIWRVLRGPSAAMRVTTDGRMADVAVPWTEPYAAPDATALRTWRVDVAVFAALDGRISAPAFFSVAFPPDERRSWSEAGRLLSVDYDPPDAGYADPLLFPRRRWRDVFAWDARDRLTGWTRERPGAPPVLFSAHGLRAAETDALGRVAVGEAVRYPIERPKGRRPEIVERPTGAFWRYRYAGDGDRIGAPEPVREAP